MANLPDTLKEALKLYAPVLTRMLTQFPDIETGIELIIGRDEPVALAVNGRRPEVAGEYSHDKLDAEIEPYLLALVQPTYDLIRNCPPIRDIHEPLYIKAERTQIGTTTAALASNRLGGISCERNALSTGQAEQMLIGQTLLKFITGTDVASQHRANIEQAAATGFPAVARYLTDNDLLLNGSFGHPMRALEFLAAFPCENKKVTVTDLSDSGILIISATSSVCPNVILAGTQEWLDKECSLPDSFHREVLPEIDISGVRTLKR
jgi:hypothetical protein